MDDQDLVAIWAGNIPSQPALLPDPPRQSRESIRTITEWFGIDHAPGPGFMDDLLRAKLIFVRGVSVFITLEEIIFGVWNANFEAGVDFESPLAFLAPLKGRAALHDTVDAIVKIMALDPVNPADVAGVADEQERIWQLIKRLSILVIYPPVIKRVAELAYRNEATALETSPEWVRTSLKQLGFKNNLLFTFALRHILTKLAFHTVLKKTVTDTLRAAVNAEYRWTPNSGATPWENAIAFVGFNRLMSPNNSAGASISSDIDFKLVFDPSVVQNRDDFSEITSAQVSKTVTFLMKLSLKLSSCQYEIIIVSI
jgi:hypothetical protein